ncbi:MAG: aminoglycoside phosphotransferase family protein [Acidimicrobiales bacterium]
MHRDQIDTDPALVRDLLEAQHAQWADRPIVRVASTGTVNALYRLGDDLVARLPLRRVTAVPIENELRWLPQLAPHLPIAISMPLALGQPTERFPSPWSVYAWFDGDDAITGALDLPQAAVDLASFLRALWSLDATGGPRPSVANYGRGIPLGLRDDITRASIRQSVDLVDTDAVTAAWERALAAQAWDQPPQWVHGDISSGNLIVRDRRIRAVIDWSLGIGDPACDVLVAWELFDRESRALFREALAVDDATWDRARGWALSTAMLALPYYVTTNEFMARQARQKIAAVLDD